MKFFQTTLTRSADCEATYTVRAENEDEARKKLFQICGEQNLKIKEI